MPHKKNASIPSPPPPPLGQEETITTTPAPAEPPELLLLDPDEIQAPEELNTRRFQTSRDSLLNLAFSMLSDGLQEPIGVTRMPDSTYLLRFGWRRWQAACLINQEQLGMGVLDGPYKLLCLVRPYLPPTKHQPPPEMVAGIVENTQRAELGPVDQAYAIQLLTGTGMSQRNIATKMGMDHTQVSRRLRLIGLPVNIQLRVNAGQIPLDAAFRILDQPDGPRRGATVEVAQNIPTPPAPEGVSDTDVRSGVSYTNTDVDVLNKATKGKGEKVVRSKTAKQMLVELEGYATPEDGKRTAAQTWVLTKLIPWIGKSSRPFQAAMEGLERLVGK